MNDDKMLLRKVMTFSDTLSVIFDLVRDGFTFSMKATLRLCGPWLVTTSILAAISISWLVSSFFGAFNETESEFGILNDAGLIEIVGIGVLIALSLLILYSISSAIQMSITYLNIKTFSETGEFASYDALKAGVRVYFKRLLLASIVTTILVNIAGQFFYLPGIFISVPLSLLMAGMVVDNLNLGSALSKVFVLIKRRWWFSFGIIAVCGIAQAIAVGIVAVPIIAVYLIVVSLGYSIDLASFVPVLVAISAVLLIVASSFSNYIGQTAQIVLYYTNSEVAEGVSLLQRVSSAFPTNTSQSEADES